MRMSLRLLNDRGFSTRRTVGERYKNRRELTNAANIFNSGWGCVCEQRRRNYFPLVKQLRFRQKAQVLRKARDQNRYVYPTGVVDDENVLLFSIDPFKSSRALAVLKKLRPVCLGLPESTEGRQFGHPVWLAGKKTFGMARYAGARLTLCFWVGVEQQGFLTADPRYQIPPYFGHNGWIALDVTEACDWKEVEGLVLQSYRHFALKRMLQKLGC